MSTADREEQLELDLANWGYGNIHVPLAQQELMLIRAKKLIDTVDGLVAASDDAAVRVRELVAAVGSLQNTVVDSTTQLIRSQGDLAKSQSLVQKATLILSFVIAAATVAYTYFEYQAAQAAREANEMQRHH